MIKVFFVVLGRFLGMMLMVLFGELVYGLSWRRILFFCRIIMCRLVFFRFIVCIFYRKMLEKFGYVGKFNF